jgi:hypothetical protein
MEATAESADSAGTMHVMNVSMPMMTEDMVRRRLRVTRSRAPGPTTTRTHEEGMRGTRAACAGDERGPDGQQPDAMMEQCLGRADT